MPEAVPLPPDLSVVVASAHGPGPLERCLQALVPQVREGRAEVIVAGTFSDEQRGRYPSVAFLSFPPKTPSPTLWGAGIACARADLVGLTETLTVVSATWVRDVLAAHRTSDRPIIGGAVEPMPGWGLVSWGAYFCDYGPFMCPLRPGEAEELPGNNTVFKRTLLDRAPAFTRPAFWKTYWCRALQAEGVPLTADPSFVVFDAKAYRLVPFLVRRFRHGRCFAGMRNAHLSSARRVLYAGASPLLPGLFVARTLRRLVPKRRHLGKLAASFPVVLLAILCWSLGEGVGYAVGGGDSCRHVY